MEKEEWKMGREGVEERESLGASGVEDEGEEWGRRREWGKGRMRRLVCGNSSFEWDIFLVLF